MSDDRTITDADAAALAKAIADEADAHAPQARLDAGRRFVNAKIRDKQAKRSAQEAELWAKVFGRRKPTPTLGDGD